MNKNYFGKVLIVDNDKSELDQLSSVLNIAGFQVNTHLYDQSEEVESYSGYRTFFFDLNITPISIGPDILENIDWETNSNLRTVFSHLATAIKEIVSIDNGPYALVLWTKHHELIDSFKSYILHRYKDSSFPHPFFVSHLDKNSFNNSAIRPQELVDALFESTILQKLMSFENLLHQEVYNLTSEIINLAIVT